MNPGVLYAMVRADFLERVRRYSFLLTLAGALYLGYGVATEKIWVVIGNGYRGVYNSAWIGAVMAVCCSTFLSLAGFYVVKNSVQRDTDTRVGQILAATPMRKSFYTLAKSISNFAVLASMVLILMVAAVAMQLLHAEISQVSLWRLWSPFLLIALPAMAITAALSVLFETVPLLSGGLGNVVYFFVWSTGLALSVATGIAEPSGIQLLFRSTRAALMKVDSGHIDSFSLTIGGERAVRTFLWNGFDWTGSIVLSRLLWIAVAVGIALLASVFFHRFDPARESWRKKNGVAPSSSTSGETPQPKEITTRTASPVRLTPFVTTRGKFRFALLVGSELRLMLKGQRWWWYAVAAGIFVGSLVSPTEAARQGWLVAAWIWPVLLWSQMGAREARFATQSLIFSCERALHRQLPALWTAGLGVALLAGGGTGLRLLLSSDWRGLVAWFAGALFIPSLALALGVWSDSSKAFEAFYTVWWYIGPLHHTPGLDFMGTTDVSSAPATWVLAAAALLTASYFGRRARLGYV
ncbi:MAG: hypothetical protein WB952_18525 [Terriglobales bacterium]